MKKQNEPASMKDRPAKTCLRICVYLVSCLFIWAGFLLLIVTHKLLSIWGHIGIDQILFHLQIPSDAIDPDVIHGICRLDLITQIYLVLGLLSGAMILLMIYRPAASRVSEKLHSFADRHTGFVHSAHTASRVSKILHFTADHLALSTLSVSLCVFLFSVCYFCGNYDVLSSIELMSQSSDIIDANYQHHNVTDFEQHTSTGQPIVDKSERPNLILIVSESLENTFSDGKAFGSNLLPELSALKSNNDSIENLYAVYGCHYTIAAMYSVHYGLPLLYFGIPSGSPVQSNIFAKNCVSIFDVLDASGYRILHLQGTSLKFAGQGSLLSHLAHAECMGSDEISLEEYANRQSWGLWDSDLFDKAKKEIVKLANTGVPFALSMQTIDTHAGNTLQPGQECRFGDFRDVIRLQSRLIADFVSWVYSQPFGANTVLVILGDHNFMGKQIGDIDTDDLEGRRIFNCIINSKSGVKIKQHEAAVFDFAPTILDALGFQWPSYSFGIGHSLYRDTPTIMEKYGYDCWDLESRKDSVLYKRLILE